MERAAAGTAIGEPPPLAAVRVVVNVGEESDAAIVGILATAAVQHGAVQGKPIDKRGFRPRAAGESTGDHEEGRVQPQSLHHRHSSSRAMVSRTHVSRWPGHTARRLRLTAQEA